MKTAIIATAAAFGFAAAANADFVDMRYLGTGKGSSVKITLNNHTSTVFAGQLNHRIKNGTGAAAALNGDHVTFCTDLYQTVSSSYTAYEIAPVATVPNSAPMGAAKAQALRNLYTYAGIAAADNSASNDMATAFQIAVWEIVTDFNGTAASLNVTAGNFKAKKTNDHNFSGTLASTLASYFTAAMNTTANQVNMLGLKSACAQDQLIAGFVVPTPGTATLALAGVAFAAGRRRR